MDERYPEEKTGLLASLELNVGVHTEKERSSQLSSWWWCRGGMMTEITLAVQT